MGRLPPVPDEEPNWEPPPDSTELESELPPDSPAAPEPEPDPDDPGEPGKLKDDAQALLEAARDALAAYSTHLRAIKRLFLEEFALARDAAVTALVFLLLSMALLATAYGLFAALVVLALHWAGLPWMLALFIPAAISVVIAYMAMQRSRALFRYADFESTRRQLDRGLTVPKEAEAQE
jgi:hypothetical protein